MIASTCLYLAGKIKDEQIKVRDIINVSRNTLHRNTLPLDLKEEYWSMRDAIVQGELLVMRMLKFEVTITHPHKVKGQMRIPAFRSFDSKSDVSIISVHVYLYILLTQGLRKLDQVCLKVFTCS